MRVIQCRSAQMIHLLYLVAQIFLTYKRRLNILHDTKRKFLSTIYSVYKCTPLYYTPFFVILSFSMFRISVVKSTVANITIVNISVHSQTVNNGPTVITSFPYLLNSSHLPIFECNDVKHVFFTAFVNGR